MKQLRYLALLLLLLPLAHKAEAQQLTFECIVTSLTPCNSVSNPGNGTQGTPIWQAGGYLNTMFGQVYGMFGGSSNFKTTGTLLSTDISSRWTDASCSGGGALSLLFNGHCSSGGGGSPAGSVNYLQYYLNSTTFGGIAPGTAGWALVSNGAGSPPSFQAGTTYPGLTPNSAVAPTDLLAGYPTGGPLGSYTASQFLLPLTNALSSATSITPGCGLNGETNFGSNTVTAGTLTANAPTGCTAAEGQVLILHVKFTNTQTWAWNAAYENGAITLPTATSGSTVGDWVGFRYDSINSKWAAMAANGGGGGTGTVTSVTCGTGLSGGTFTTSGTCALTAGINAQTGSSYTFVSTDATKLVTFSNASATAVTLPVATTSGFGAGFSIDVQNLGVGTVTITPTTSTINGAATLTIATNLGCSITSDGTNYQVSACTALGGTTKTIASGSTALGTSAIASGACATVVTATATGTLTTDTINAGFNGDPTAVTGYIPSSSGMLTIITYPTANTFNAKVCNNTASSITPAALTINWHVLR